MFSVRPLLSERTQLRTWQKAKGRKETRAGMFVSVNRCHVRTPAAACLAPPPFPTGIFPPRKTKCEVYDLLTAAMIMSNPPHTHTHIFIPGRRNRHRSGPAQQIPPAARHRQHSPLPPAASTSPTPSPQARLAAALPPGTLRRGPHGAALGTEPHSRIVSATGVQDPVLRHEREVLATVAGGGDRDPPRWAEARLPESNLGRRDVDVFVCRWTRGSSGVGWVFS